MSEFQREARFFAELPVMPLREVVMLPRTIMPLFVGREASIKAIELAQSGYNKQMFLVAQREPDVEKPGADDLSPVGVVCKVLQMLRLPDGTIKVLFEGLHRARWTELREEDNCLMAMLCTVPESESRPEEREALVRTVQEALEEYAKNNKKLTQEALMSIMALRDAGPLADAVVPHLKVDYRKKQEVLEIADVTERLERVYELLQGEVALASVEKRIKNRVKVQMERNQREYYLSEQLKAINKEMGREDDPQAEVDELEKKLEGRNMPQEARERCQSELRKLRATYLLQWEMMRWALAEGCTLYDFRGVSGDLSPDNPLYGLYRFKKGFGGEFTEFCGEFELCLKPGVSRSIELLRKVYNKTMSAAYRFKNRGARA